MSSDQASTSSSQNTIILQSSDGQTFEIKEQAALLSQTIKHMIEDDCAGSCIPLPKVTGKILAKVVEYCTTHVESCGDEKALKAFDAEFVKVDQETLFDIIMAANFLSIRSLLECMCQSVADMVKGKSTPEIRKLFNIRNDLTPEEEEEIREENAWAFN